MWWHKDTVLDYPLFLPIFLLVFFFAANSGFWLATLLIRKDKLLWVRVSYVGIMLFCGVWIFGLWNRTTYLGSYNEWVQGTAQRVWDTSGGELFIYVFVFTLTLWTVALVLFISNLRSEGKYLDN